MTSTAGTSTAGAGAEPVLLEKREGGRIWVITLNRPERMNAIGGGMMESLVEMFLDFRDDMDARVAILTGAGERAFCVGFDLRDVAERRAAQARGEAAAPRQAPWGTPPRQPASIVPLAEGLDVWKPVIGAVNGYAIAGGFMLAMQCDIRILAEHARVGVSEVRWNLGSGWMAPITRQIGLGNALELCLWGDTQFTAQRAYEIGWAQRVVPTEQLMPVAMQYAERMLDMAPRAVRNVKQMIYRGFNRDPLESQRIGGWLIQNLGGMQDSAEGPRAFLEKRRPNYTDS